MTAPSNLSFETGDATPGSALGWTLTPVSSASVIGQYDAGRRERFEWLTGYRLDGRTSGDTTAGNADSFTWTESYIFGAQQDGNLETGSYDSVQVQRFSKWITLTEYRAEREPGDVTAGAYDSLPAQRFSKWLASLTGYRVTRDPGDVTAAAFDSGARTTDRFIAVRDAEWTATAGSVELESDDPPMVGSAVYVSTTDTLPGGFAVDTAYAVVNRSGSTFRLATGPSHPAITPTTTGTGTHSLTAAPEFCWPAD